MNFNVQLDGMPLMTCIEHRGFVSSFLTCLNKSGVRKISFNKNEAVDALSKNPSFLTGLIREGITDVYNFIYIGYMFDVEETAAFDCPAEVKRDLLGFLKNILTDNISFFITFETLRKFYGTGKVIIPLIGTLTLPADKRISYLKRFYSYINDSSPDKITAANSVYPKAAVLCSKTLNIVYIADDDGHGEKIHCLETDLFGTTLKKELYSNGPRVIEFSMDLWNSYMKEAETAIKQRSL